MEILINYDLDFLNKLCVEGCVFFNEPINIKILVLHTENFSSTYNLLERGSQYLSNFMEVYSHAGRPKTNII